MCHHWILPIALVGFLLLFGAGLPFDVQAMERRPWGPASAIGTLRSCAHAISDGHRRVAPFLSSIFADRCAGAVKFYLLGDVEFLMAKTFRTCIRCVRGSFDVGLGMFRLDIPIDVADLPPLLVAHAQRTCRGGGKAFYVLKATDLRWVSRLQANAIFGTSSENV